MRSLKLSFLVFIYIFFLRCSQVVEDSKTVVFFQNKKSKWIQDKRILPQSDDSFLK